MASRANIYSLCIFVLAWVSPLLHLLHQARKSVLLFWFVVSKWSHNMLYLYLLSLRCFHIFFIGITTLLWSGRKWNSDDNSTEALILCSQRSQAFLYMAVRTVCSRFRLLYSSIHFSLLLCQEKLLPVWGLLSSRANVSAVTSQASSQTAHHAEAAEQGRLLKNYKWSSLVMNNNDDIFNWTKLCSV